MYDLLAQLLSNTQLSTYLNASLTSNECTFDAGSFVFEFYRQTITVCIRDTGFEFTQDMGNGAVIIRGELLTVSQLKSMFPAGDEE